MLGPAEDSTTLSADRVDAPSDGVIAVAATLLVLDLTDHPDLLGQPSPGRAAGLRRRSRRETVNAPAPPVLDFILALLPRHLRRPPRPDRGRPGRAVRRRAL